MFKRIYCTVPDDQLPINKYIQLTSIWDFSWSVNQMYS